MTGRELIEDVARRLAERTNDEDQGFAADLLQALRTGLDEEVDE